MTGTTKAKGGSYETLKQMNRRHAVEFKQEIEAGYYTEHEQPAREGEEWRSVNMTDTAFDHRPAITIEQGDRLLATVYSFEAAEAIIRDHRLAALVPGLVGTITELLNQFYPHQCHIKNGTCRRCDVLRSASQLLNTVTKEHEK